MERMIAALARDHVDDVAELLTGLARATSRTTPDWRVVSAPRSLTEWCDPSRRDAVPIPLGRRASTPQLKPEAKDAARQPSQTTAETETETEHS